MARATGSGGRRPGAGGRGGAGGRRGRRGGGADRDATPPGDERLTVVAEGDWLYDGAVSRPVWIVRTDFDVWYEIAKAGDQLEPGEGPRLNEDGHAFYTCFQWPVPDAFWPAGGGSPTLEDARRRAEARVPAGIAWHA